MLDTNSATARLVNQVRSTEGAIEKALVEVTSLLNSAAQAQQDTGIANPETQAALLHLSKLSATMIAAQSDVMRVHASLAKVGTIVNGPEEPTCPKVFTTAKKAVVAA